VVIKTNRSDKTEIKKILKISSHQQSWSRPLPGAILIPPALLVVADFCMYYNKDNKNNIIKELYNSLIIK